MIHVEDLREALDAWRLASGVEPMLVAYEDALIRLGDIFLILVEAAEHERPGLGLVTMATPDLEALKVRVQAAGVGLMDAPEGVSVDRQAAHGVALTLVQDAPPAEALVDVHDDAEDAASISVLIAKPGLDGHDRGAKVVARALQETGMKVTYTGIRQTPESIARRVAADQPDVLGVSILSGAHLTLFPRLFSALEKEGVDMARLIVVAGGIIPDEDVPALRELGVDAVFGPGSSLAAMTEYIRRAVGQRRRRS